VEESAIQNALRGLAGGRVWDAAEYGIAAEQAAAMIAATDTPEARERVMVDLRNRAIRRAGLDTSNGRVAVMVAGNPAWHGLGVNVREAVNSADAIRLAGLDWLVRKIQLEFKNPITGQMANAEGEFGIVREDTGSMLGAVGKLYKPFQNRDGFNFLDGILEGFEARYESAGAIYGGSSVWMLVNMPKQAFSLNGVDEIQAYVIFTNSHDGSAAARCFPTSQRVVCANTYRLAQSDADKGLTIRHTGNLECRRETAQRALGLAVQGMDRFKESAKQLATTPVEPKPYFNGLLDAVLKVTEADALKGADALAAALMVTEAEETVKAAEFSREIDKRKSLLDELLERYEGERCGIGGMRGSGWAAFNAVTEAADHGKLGGRYVGSNDDRKSRRFESIINGPADEVKQVAFEQVMNLAKAN